MAGCPGEAPGPNSFPEPLMSDHHRLHYPAKPTTFVPSAKWVFRHEGSRFDFLNRYLRLARHAHKQRRGKLKAVAALAPDLLYLISDTKTLRVAWDHLEMHGGQAPGPDGICYWHLDSEHATWRMCQQYKNAIRAGKYKPWPEREVKFSKGPGRGYRPLVLLSVMDRMVHRAAVEILQPLLDPLFMDGSCGYRPKRGREDALARAWRYYLDDSPVWIAVDIRDAFMNVPVERVLPIVKKYLPDEDLIAFLRCCLANSSTKGLRQGSPLSPLMLNLYLHHHLDRFWAKTYADNPLIRVADDILVLCGDRQWAETLYDDLSERLGKIGLKLKESKADAIHDLSQGDAVDWIGYRVQGGGERLHVSVSDRGWEGLVEQLALAGKELDRNDRGNAVLRGWIGQQGACFDPEYVPEIRKWMAAVAKENGIKNPLSQEYVKKYWQRAHARWCKRLAKELPACPLEASEM